MPESEKLILPSLCRPWTLVSPKSQTSCQGPWKNDPVPGIGPVCFCLIHVFEVGTEVTQLRPLPLGQPHDPSRPRPPPVLQHDGGEIARSGEGRQRREGDPDRIALGEERRVVKRVGRDDAANVAKTDLPRRADGTSMVASQVPAQG